ncbi:MULTISPECIES: response regulator transcription factor [Hyphobacterium]|uniref:Response regulator n=1 Tax=Hyphobacterium vulgare TaxID=1736751 RepID=A0ABV7A0T9_9PROT
MIGAQPRIAIVEDDDALRLFLAGIIENSSEFALAFVCGTRAEACEGLREGGVDLCLVDLGLPDGSGVDVIRAAKAGGQTRALVLSVLGDRVTVMQALAAGADGYLLKSGRPDIILKEIRETLSGMAPVSPQVAAYLVDLVRPSPSSQSSGQPELSEREVAVLELFSRGMSYRETAELLAISVNTVSDHVRKIYSKLSVHSRNEAVFEAQSLGLIGARAGVRPEPKPE